MPRYLLLLLCAVLATARGADLPANVDLVLRGHGISANDVSIVVQAVDAAEPVLSHLPEVARNPASVMKVVTTWVALEYLGPAYRWPTEVYLNGDFDGATLDGDLAIKGYGDPYLVLEEFWKVLRGLRRLGLEDIDGDLIIDDSFFAIGEPDPGEFDGQPFRTYNVVPSALLVNFKAVHFSFFADPASGRVRIVTDPVLGNLDIRNNLDLAEGPCRGYQAGISFNLPDAERMDRVVFDGSFPARCRSYGMSRTVLQHDTYTLGLFAELWRELGGRFDGEVRRAHVAEDIVPFMTWHSPPLAEVIRSINKNSNNVMTRQLIYTLGAIDQGTPGTRANGIAAVRDFLAGRGMDVESLLIDNGAGLSREETISAGLLTELLRQAAESRYAAEFIASLSLGGLDGTTRGRFGDAGDMHVKTGRIDNVSAVAGYLHSDGGPTYVIAVLANTENAHRGPGREIEEAVIDWVRSLN
jgi:D-alanyl-D-alanine carboxypeptidase/D-alanyl-D-alanine-endopeptidase (penicillin-binding protein 4)